MRTSSRLAAVGVAALLLAAPGTALAGSGDLSGIVDPVADVDDAAQITASGQGGARCGEQERGDAHGCQSR